MQNAEKNRDAYDPLAWLKGYETPEQKVAVEINPPTNVQTMSDITSEITENKSVEGITPETGSVDIVLAEDLTIAHVAELHSQWSALISSDQSILLDGTCVTQVDTAGLQLLLGFLKGARDRGLQVKWVNPSSVLLSAASDLALDEALGLPSS